MGHHITVSPLRDEAPPLLSSRSEIPREGAWSPPLGYPAGALSCACGRVKLNRLGYLPRPPPSMFFVVWKSKLSSDLPPRSLASWLDDFLLGKKKNQMGKLPISLDGHTSLPCLSVP